MASVICKDSDEIFYILFGDKHDSTFNISIHDLPSLVKKNKKGRYIDTRILRLEYYDGWKDNQHHITTKSCYNILCPFFSYIIKTFNFNFDDFVTVPFFTKDFTYDCSYLKPKMDMKFSLEINGIKIGEHLEFDKIQNVVPNNDTEAFSGYVGSLVPTHSEYHRLYRGAHACSVLTNETIENEQKIFISGDSMMIPIIPILACYYKEVVFMDNRDGKSHKVYFEGKVFDEVLLCFSPHNNKVLNMNFL